MTPESTTSTAAGAYVLARQAPDRLALIDPDGRPVTFGQLGEAANRVANALRAAGVGTGDVVAVLLHNSSEFYDVLLATGQIGVYFVPINVHLTPPEVAYVVADSGARVLVAHSDLAAGLAPVAGEFTAKLLTIGDPVDGWEDYAAFKASGSPQEPADRMAGMPMGYTSGTTGRPRGVRRGLPPIDPETLAAFRAAFMAGFDIGPGPGVHLVCSPLYHAAPLNIAVQLLDLGNTLVLQRKFEPEDVLRDIERYRVTNSQMVPTHLHRLLRLPAEVRKGYDLSSLGTLLVAGAPFGAEAKRAVLDWLGPVVWEYLAATEGMVSIAAPQDAISHPGTVGRPVVDVRIVDGEGVPVPAGEVGRIFFAVPARFEYHNDPAKTAEALTDDGYATAGDLGRLDADGYLYLLDRRDDLIISGGVNIYPAEVEQRLLGHPAVGDVAVVGVSDPEWGQSVVAVVQLEPGWAADDKLIAELDQHCRGGLAAQKRPRRYEFRAELPRTPAGKLLRRQLRDEFAN